ncbi:MAG: hypothetical protein M3Q65_13165 [Chloroflexota bacterium]|nr:hypothetical protein [Chloroflexota bacterium]
MRDVAGTAPAVERALAELGWARHLGALCALMGRAPAGTLPAVSATICLDGRPGEARLLLGVCAALGRRYGLDPVVCHTGAAATYTVRLRRGAGIPVRG